MRRYILFNIVLYFVSLQVYTIEISIGDSLKDIIGNINEDDYLGMDNLGLWPENEYHVYNIEDDNRIFLSMNFYPFGVLVEKNDTHVFLIDFDGDSYLDFEANYLYIPPWVISLNSNGSHSGNFMLEYLDLTSKAFQSDELPQDSDDMKIRTTKLIEIADNRNAEDRVYVYYDYLYNYLYSRKEYETAYYCLQNLFQSMNSPQNETILIYMVELAYRNGQLNESRGLNNILIEYFPDFIPGLVYQYILEEDQELKEKYKMVLLEEHANHWMVKEKIK